MSDSSNAWVTKKPLSTGKDGGCTHLSKHHTPPLSLTTLLCGNEVTNLKPQNYR